MASDRAVMMKGSFRDGQSWANSSDTFIANGEALVRGEVARLSQGQQQDMLQRIHKLFDGASIITMREVRSIFRVMQIKVGDQELQALFEKYRPQKTSGALDMFSVLKIVYGPDKAKQSWAKASGCKLPGIQTPGIGNPSQSIGFPSSRRGATVPGRSQSVQEHADPKSSFMKVKKAISSWCKREKHQSYWSAYNNFKDISKGLVRVASGDALEYEGFACSLKTVDPTITAATASAAFAYCDKSKNRSLKPSDFEPLLPKLDRNDPIWLTRKHMRIVTTPPQPGARNSYHVESMGGKMLPRRTDGFQKHHVVAVPDAALHRQSIRAKMGTTSRTFPKFTKPEPKHGWPWLTDCIDNAPDKYDINLAKPKFVRKLAPSDHQNCLFHKRPHSRGDPLETDAAEFCHEWHWREARGHNQNTNTLLSMGLKGDYRDYMVAKYGLER